MDFELVVYVGLLIKTNIKFNNMFVE